MKRYPVRRMTDAEDNREHSLYRLYDAEGNVLYIGCTSDVNHRLYMHMNTNVHADAYWIQLGCTEHYAQVIGTRAQAREAERRAIADEAPWFNRQHNPTRWHKQGDEWVSVDPEAREELLESIRDYAALCREFAS